MSSASRTFHLNLSGQKWSVEVTDEALAKVHWPLLTLMENRARLKAGRYIVLLGGAPAAGKTTLAALWEMLAREHGQMLPVQPLPLDGFHFTNEYLSRTTIDHQGEQVALKSIKGWPETFDLARVRDRLRAIRAGEDVYWPFYDRVAHDPVEDAIRVLERGILIVEGNYVLLDQPGWRDLALCADLKIFIQSAEATLQEAIARFQKGGRSYEEALQHYDTVDLPNYRLITGKRVAADVTLLMSADRSLSIQGSPPK